MEIPAERQARIDQGRWLHRHLGTLLGPAAALEVRVRRAGCVGRIDGLGDAPVEVKTGATAVAPTDLPLARPDHVEQLAMYCAMTDLTQGRLISIAVDGEAVRGLRTAEITFGDLPGILEEMSARATALRAAIAAGSPAGLPPCRWFGRGCEFQDGGRCDCGPPVGDTTSRILERIRSVGARSDLDEELRGRLDRLAPTSQGDTLERFRDLLYPRRAYFERTAPGPPTIPSVSSPADPPDLYARLIDALETGPIGEVARIPPRAPEVEEDVTGFRGVPFLVRTTRAWDPIPPAELVHRAPQYPLELGYRCAVTGSGLGRVVLGYERAEKDPDRLDVFEIRFTSVTPFARQVREGSQELARALRDRRPLDLPACPGWMFSDCPYAAECRCGEAVPRSQR